MPRKKKKKLCEDCYYNDGVRCISHSYFHAFDTDGNLMHIDTYGKKIEWLRNQAELCRCGCSSYRPVRFLYNQRLIIID